MNTKILLFFLFLYIMKPFNLHCQEFGYEGAEQQRVTTFFRPNFNLINKVLESKQHQYDIRTKNINDFYRCEEETHRELAKFDYFLPVDEGFHNVKVLGEGVCGYSSVWVENNLVKEYWIVGGRYKVIESDFIDEKTFCVFIKVQFNDGSSVPLRVYFHENFKK